jgi:hypothetical protein
MTARPEEMAPEQRVERPVPRPQRRFHLRARDLVVLLVAVLAFYVVLIGAQGVSLLGDHRVPVKLLGIGVLLLPLIGIVVVAAELRFGRATQRLAERLGPDPGPPDPALSSDAAFAVRQAQVEADPESWQAWYRLAVAYGDARDTARGRRAMRRAISLHGAMFGDARGSR